MYIYVLVYYTIYNILLVIYILYDTNNSDTSFEFEITMVKNKKLLT